MSHISYSQYRQYTSCPRQYYLARLKGGQERQSWYIPIGSAVHAKIEDTLRGVPEKPMEEYFYPLVRSQMDVDPAPEGWLSGGPESDPVTHEKALQRAVDCYEKAAQELQDIEVWEVEADVSWRLPGLEVPIKAFVDIIGEHKKKGPSIWDWKTGSTKPDNFQLTTYAALLKVNDSLPYTLEDFHGRYMMISPAYTGSTRYVDLSGVKPEEVGAKYQAVYDRIKEKHYEAKPSFNCKFCFQADNCLVNKGMTKRAMFYDKSEEDGYPF